MTQKRINELNKPIKHLRQVNYNVPKSAPKQRKLLFERIMLSPMSIALCVYLGIILMIVLLTIKI
jgi:hypothetical protein